MKNNAPWADLIRRQKITIIGRDGKVVGSTFPHPWRDGEWGVIPRECTGPTHWTRSVEAAAESLIYWFAVRLCA